MPSVSANPDSEPTIGRGWEQFPHDADVGLHGFGSSIEVAFEQPALALTGIVTDAEIAPTTRVDVICEAADIELLLVEWLNAIIYEMAVLASRFSFFFASTSIFLDGPQYALFIHLLPAKGAARGKRTKTPGRQLPTPYDKRRWVHDDIVPVAISDITAASATGFVHFMPSSSPLGE